ncbi:MAG: hypothetical protein IJU70_09105 [Lentisphaeria bacterium]|nr:hypothetical protein [Lentisphaeria bacterium]
MAGSAGNGITFRGPSVTMVRGNRKEKEGFRRKNEERKTALSQNGRGGGVFYGRTKTIRPRDKNAARRRIIATEKTQKGKEPS